ncbi:MAG: DJ-1/PfpI family protein [Planctomycetes bacterium]|nr:DJ-1/PfpI family protein [Planctomycetota bacterium]MBI3845143.1 DJ-1/PfpI family protein [Planctomycetota bacterium]
MLPSIRAQRALACLALSSMIAATGNADEANPPFHTLRVGIVVYEGVELLDFAGPTEVFDAAKGQAGVDDVPWFEILTVCPTEGPVSTNGSVVLEPRFTPRNCPPLDVLVVPGGETGALANPEFLRFLTETATHAKVMLSVCNAAFTFAKAGLLDGREATTTHSFISELSTAGKNIRGVSERVVDSGTIVTAGGVSCGIDGALHVVAKLCGRKNAEAVAAYLEHPWQPGPKLEKLYTDWSPLLDERGRMQQELASHRRRRDWAGLADVARRIIAADPNDGVACYELGLALHMQKKIDEAIPFHERAAALGAKRAPALYNLACAVALEGDKEKALETLGRAVDAGWLRRSMTEQDGDLASVRADPRFARLLDRMGPPGVAGPSWASDVLAAARESLAKANPNAALDGFVAAALSPSATDDTARDEIQRTLARRDVEPSELTWKARRILASHPFCGHVALSLPDEPGDPLVVTGTVCDPRGKPIAGAVVHVFHADASGRYTPAKAMDEPNARLNGWVATDANGRYEFRSVRPGGYAQPRSDVPADAGDERWIPEHVHIEVAARGSTRRFQLVFADDPRMTPRWQQWARENESPVISLTRDESGVLHGTCDVTMR